MTRPIATFSRLGRLGRFANGAWQIAGTMGIARRNGLDPRFPLWRNYDGLNFESGLDIEVHERFVNPLPLYDGPPLPGLGIPFGYHDVRVNSDVDLEGHFQSQKYFEHCLDEVKFYLTMIDEPPVNDLCGIHLRLGDYGPQASPQHPDGNSYHPRMNMNYLAPAMALFGSDQKFLVFSDGIEECKAMLGVDGKVTYSEGRSYLDDFRLLKSCRHFIISNSSFSAMAAVLGDATDKQVVAPEPWFGGPYEGRMNAEDIYTAGWQVINYQTGALRLKA